MDYTFHITVHVYAEEKFVDGVLALHSKNYGIVGKNIIAPLRKVNNKEYYKKNIQKSFTVKDLWSWINYITYGNEQGCNAVKKYLVFNTLRYKIEDTNKTLYYFLSKMKITETDKINIQLLVSSDAGTIFKDNGIRYYLYSKESGSHNKPHVHVDIRNEVSGSFSIENGEQLAGANIRKKDINEITNMITKNKSKLTKYWNEHTDGLTVDLNQALGLID